MTESQSFLSPDSNDVLSGRGNYVNNHVGNENFRARVKHYQRDYLLCTKDKKPIFAKIIYDEIKTLHPPGRFLKLDGKTNVWFELSQQKAMNKIRQALRENAPEIKEELLRELKTNPPLVQPSSQIHFHPNFQGCQQPRSLPDPNIPQGYPIIPQIPQIPPMPAAISAVAEKETPICALNHNTIIDSNFARAENDAKVPVWSGSRTYSSPYEPEEHGKKNLENSDSNITYNPIEVADQNINSKDAELLQKNIDLLGSNDFVSTVSSSNFDMKNTQLEEKHSFSISSNVPMQSIILSKPSCLGESERQSSLSIQDLFNASEKQVKAQTEKTGNHSSMGMSMSTDDVDKSLSAILDSNLTLDDLNCSGLSVNESESMNLSISGKMPTLSQACDIFYDHLGNKSELSISTLK